MRVVAAAVRCKLSPMPGLHSYKIHLNTKIHNDDPRTADHNPSSFLRLYFCLFLSIFVFFCLLWLKIRKKNLIPILCGGRVNSIQPPPKTEIHSRALLPPTVKDG